MLDTLLQFNDQTITVPVTYKGVEFDLSDVSIAEYKLYDAAKKTVILSLDLMDGITIIDSTFTIFLSKVNSEQLKGKYYHELVMEEPIHMRTTVFKDFIIFEPTYNT